MSQSAPASNGRRPRRLGGWGFEGEGLEPPPRLLSRLEERLGAFSPPGWAPARPDQVAPGRDLGALPCEWSAAPLERLARARGQGLPDLIRLRSGTVPALPDAVARPGDATEIERLLAACAAAEARVIPRGGGTSVTGGVNVHEDGAPAVSLDLERFNALEELDEVSGLATLGAGATGPEIEAALAARGFTLGHFPQSWELSTLGGWIATRASGQESLGYGSIADLVAGVEVVAPAGRLSLPACPASAAGPDLRQLVLGSEGRLGVITRATVRVRPRPECVEVAALLLPDWAGGLAAVRELSRGGPPLTLLRLSDEAETEIAVALGLASRPWAAPALRAWLRLRGVGGSPCLLLAGAAGEPATVRATLEETRALLRRHGAVGLGRGPGRRWLAERFRHPYLRDALLDRGVATDTLETAAPWSRLPALTEAVRRALDSSLTGENERVVTLCHVSHTYGDGGSLYFTFFFRCPGDPERAIARWAAAKRAATAALAPAGGTVSHHHGVGSWHAPWLEAELGETGLRLLAAAAGALDPGGILNPHALLDPVDRLQT